MMLKCRCETKTGKSFAAHIVARKKTANILWL